MKWKYTAGYTDVPPKRQCATLSKTCDREALPNRLSLQKANDRIWLFQLELREITSLDLLMKGEAIGLLCNYHQLSSSPNSKLR